MYSGSYLEEDDTDGIIIGRQIAGNDVELNAFSFKSVGIGDKVLLASGSISKEFTVRGIFYTKYIQSEQRAFITIEALNQLSTIVLSTRHRK